VKAVTDTKHTKTPDPAPKKGEGGSGFEGPSVLQRIAAGDPAAPQQVIDAYGNLVWSIARRMLGHGPDTEDAVQEVFIEIWKHAGRFDGTKGTEVGFVAMIARRRVVDVVRKRQRQPDIEPLPESIGMAPEDTAQQAEQADEVARATRALEQLPEQRQQVLKMALLSGRTHSEIAERSGLPLGTVKTHMRRGLMRIRELLDDDEGNS
jgi:RNA polymerase sigma-70 factor (ECF subfamily)